MNTAGMILGIVAVPLGCLPLVGFIALPFAVVGIPLSGVGMSRNRRRGEGTGQALTGLILNIVASALGVFWLAVIIIYFANRRI